MTTKFEQQLTLGAEYREDYTFDLYGEEVTVVIKPLKDKFFIPLAGSIADALGIEDENLDEEDVTEEALEEIDGDFDVGDLDEQFVNQMQKAAVLGLVGAYDEDGDLEEFDKERASEQVSKMVGGMSLELGGEVLDLSGNIDEAEKFRSDG